MRRYLAINSVGGMIITEGNIGVAVYDKEGKRMRSLCQDIKQPMGVADADNTLMCHQVEQTSE